MMDEAPVNENPGTPTTVTFQGEAARLLYRAMAATGLNMDATLTAALALLGGVSDGTEHRVNRDASAGVIRVWPAPATGS